MPRAFAPARMGRARRASSGRLDTWFTTSDSHRDPPALRAILTEIHEPKCGTLDDFPLRLSVVIPAHDEVESVGLTVHAVVAELGGAGIDYEVLVVDDASSDGTADEVQRIAAHNERVTCIRSPYPPGFGHAVRAGLDLYTGDAVAIMMADLSDSPRDLILYYHRLREGYDCVFGTRFGSGGTTTGYPWLKLILNRITNTGIRLLFQHGYNDTTNAFKAYRRHVIDQVQPLLSHHFNLTVELPLKSIARGYTYAVVPVSWTNRRYGMSKLRLHEMGSRYAFIILYVWLEHHLSRGDYRRTDQAPAQELRRHTSAPAHIARRRRTGGPA